MFTGLIEQVGTVVSTTPTGRGLRLEIASRWDDLVDGESIAVSGACLTVTGSVPAGEGSRFTVEAVTTTVGRTGIGGWRPGRRVNLERALRAGDRLGGHLVQGHVDGVGRVARVGQTGDARVIDIEVPPSVSGVSVLLGSITVDGVSLTVNDLPEPGVVQVSIIPYTLEHTSLGSLEPGDEVHLEGDVVGKYVQAMLERRGGS